MIKSVSDSQNEILESILKLHYPNWGDGYEADITYGNGSFYKEIKPPCYKTDISPQIAGVVEADSKKTGLPTEMLKTVVFDPPFLTYIKAAREHNSIMAKRYGGYWTYDELLEHYRHTLAECNRILQKKGTLIFKCQDIIHNHKMHCTHAHVIRYAEFFDFRLKDLFVLSAKNRMAIPQQKGTAKKKQKHARIHHSYFLVFEKTT